MNDPEILVGPNYVIEAGKRFDCELAAVAVAARLCKERIYRVPLKDPGENNQ
jgi:hypothetical protein